MTVKRILIVDDEPLVIRVLKLALQRAGYEVETASNGEEALARVHERFPDALITDIEMPKMTGEDLCKELERTLPDRKFPIFVATSVAKTEHRVWSSRIDNLTFLEKPVSARKLLVELSSRLASAGE